MIELSQKIFLQWLEIVLSQSWKSHFHLVNNDTEQCYSTSIISKNFNHLQLTINVELKQVAENISEPVNVLCFFSQNWHLRLLEPKSITTKQVTIERTTQNPENSSSEIGFSQAKIVLISFCGTILAMFFVVVIVMRIRNYLKRRTKLYRDALSPGLPVIYQDFDLNPRSEERYRPHHHDMQWTRHMRSYKRDMNSPIKPTNMQIGNCKDHCNCPRCKLTESIKVANNPRNCSLRPLMNSCNLAELKRNMNSENSKETVLESSFSGVQSTSTKRRRHSLVDQIESVMNKHFDKSGISKTRSNENLKSKSAIYNLNLMSLRSISKSGTRSSSKLPYRFRKAISLRRRLSVDELPSFRGKTQSYRHNINTIS